MRSLFLVLLVLAALAPHCGGDTMTIPSDFPTFTVPGHSKEMASLRALYWLHYPGSGPKSTLWDIWLAPPSLWPAVDSNGSADSMRKAWDDMLSGRIMEDDGYVSVHQHPSIAHPHGWPFPFWHQGEGGYGWHFSFKDTIGPPWRPDKLSTTDGWTLTGASAEGITEDGWKLELAGPHAAIETPERKIDTFQSPFLQLRWTATGLGSAQPFVEWTTADQPRYTRDRRVYFDPIESTNVVYTVIPMSKHPRWTGEVTQLRINFGNPAAKAGVIIHSFFTQYDTRHDINGQCFVSGCVDYFHWTRDVSFLRRNISRMRAALRYVMTEHHALEKKVVYNTWVGHDGRSGLKFENGKKQILHGHGIGDNYWDLLPCGNLDAYATILYYHALLQIAQVEREITEHPEWNIPEGAFKLDPDWLMKHAAEVKREGNKLFWNAENGRFINCIDADGKTHDFGYTFLNLEAVYYGFATPAHARSIMSWISGERIVKGDTAQGEDIYHWRFGPRSTTKRNVEYYFWGWSGPESIPWGGQVQDGGAVLGFSYHDLMARLETRGPDDTWKRLQETIKWFDEVQAAGGYRKYYDGKREGTLQGGGTAGGLGLDCEFFESVLAPQVMMHGFLGLAVSADGFSLNPRLPSNWPELVVDRIRFQDLTLSIRATRDSIEIRGTGTSDRPCYISLPKGDWKAHYFPADGPKIDRTVVRRESDGAFEMDLRRAAGIRFDRVVK